jgi:hypothetical protein
MLAAMTESTGECLVLGYGFSQILACFLMTCHTEFSWCGHGVVYLQGVMCLVTAKAVTGELALSMRLMAL